MRQKRSDLLRAEERRRVRLLTTVSLLLFGMGPIFIYRYSHMGFPELAVAVGIMMLFSLLTLGWVRKSGNASRGGLLMTFGLIALLVYSSWFSGGISDPNFGWFYVIPMLGALLVSPRVGWLFSAMVFFLAIVFWMVPQYGLEISNSIPAELSAEENLAIRLSAVVAIGVILGAFSAQQNFARNTLERVNNELTYEMNQRSEMQARVVRSERAASMGSLAAGMAHEINNPLTYVIGNLELLKTYLPQGMESNSEEMRAEAEAMLSEAVEGAYRVASLVRDLKTFSHTSEEEMASIDLGETIDRATKMVGNEIRHRARLEIECPAGVNVLGNQGRILQVVINLLTNAAHAIEPGSVESNAIRLSVSSREGRILLKVMDSGSGIDPDLSERIFEPFFTTKAVGFGMGMGLSITRNILHSMGGTIDLEYSSAEGTAFVVAFPPFPEGAAEAEGEDRGRIPGPRPRLRILVVDDEESVLRYLAVSLSHHDVTTEVDGDAAVERATEGTFDIILCDLMMPRKTGMEIHADLQQRRPAMADRMIFMTGGVFVEEAAAFLSDLSGRWVEKPIDFGELEGRIWARMEAPELEQPVS